MSGQIIFILWRESIEALLVIGILFSWLARNNAGPRAKAYLWGGVLAGFALALAFALAILGFSEVLPTNAQDYLMTAMLFVAAGLIVQMVLWMRAHGRTLKRELEQGLDAAAEADHWWSVFILAMLAVGREGSETVVFLYGTLAAAKGAALASAGIAALIGLAAAFGTFALLQLSSRILPWRSFFRISEIILLLLGSALFLSGVGNLISLGFLPYTATVWDLGWLLDDGSRFGGVIASLTGYRSAPDVITLAAWGVYWVSVWVLLRLGTRRAARARLAPHG